MEPGPDDLEGYVSMCADGSPSVHLLYADGYVCRVWLTPLDPNPDDPLVPGDDAPGAGDGRSGDASRGGAAASSAAELTSDSWESRAAEGELLGAVGRYFYEPDGAVIRAGLVQQWAARHELAMLDPHIAFLTGERVPDGYSGFPFIEAVPLKKLRAALKAHGAGSLEILVRGVNVDPDQLRGKLKLKGGRPMAVAIARIGEHEWPQEIPIATRQLLEGVSEMTGIPFTAETIGELLAELGSVEKFVAPTLQNTSNPTYLDAGYKHNVIPGTATGYVDCRTLPGQHEDVMLTIKELAGEGIDIEVNEEGPALEAPFEVPLVAQMQASLRSADPEAAILPYTLSGGTDNKSLSELGIAGYGFAPLRLTGDLDFPAMFHGVDERVPVDALTFGTRVLGDFLMKA